MMRLLWFIIDYGGTPYTIYHKKPAKYVDCTRLTIIKKTQLTMLRYFRFMCH